MKNYNIIIFSCIVSLIALAFSSCDNAEDEEYGNALLYIPQAVVSGSSNNTYIVKLPSTTNQDTVIPVGLYRSGLQELKSVAVDVVVDEDLLKKAIENSKVGDAFYNAKLLPQEYYTIPTSISLKDGQRDTWEKLQIKKALLLEDITSSSVKYILPVRIVNPTRYELNENLSYVFYIFQKK